MPGRTNNWVFGESYTALEQQRLPSSLRHLGWILLVVLALFGVALTVTPWVQTTSGFGAVTAIDPSKRQHDLHTLVAGRVDKWFVRDGDRVVAGEPVMSIIDNDPRLVERLQAEMTALDAQLAAARLATTTARQDYERRRSLRDQGLVSERDYEQARIRLQQLLAAESMVEGQMARASVAQAQLSQQTVTAPSDGLIIATTAADTATYVERGATIASFLPDNAEPVVEIFVSGRDVPLVRPGRKVRLQFDGWPAVQFSGWPSVAVGTFGGLVSIVEATAQPDGRFRVFVEPDPDDHAWPDERFVRFGAKARGWVLLDQVPLGYELWRLLNQFPPNYGPEAESGA